MDDPTSRLAAHFAARDDRLVVSAYLFGSRAEGRAHRNSDVDVAVLLDRQLLVGRDVRSRFATELTSDLIAVTHRNEVDVVVLNDAPPELALRAIDDGVRVFCRDAEADFRFGLQVRSRHIDLQPFLRWTRRLKADAIRS